MSAIDFSLPAFDPSCGELLDLTRFEDYCMDLSFGDLPSPLVSSGSTHSTSPTATTPLISLDLTVDPVVLLRSPDFIVDALCDFDFGPRKRSRSPSLAMSEEEANKRLRHAQYPASYKPASMETATARKPFAPVFDPVIHSRQQSYSGYFPDGQLSSNPANPRAFSLDHSLHIPRSTESSSLWTPHSMTIMPSSEQRSPDSHSPSHMHDWSRATSSSAQSFDIPSYSPAYSPSNTSKPNPLRPNTDFIYSTENYASSDHDDLSTHQNHHRSDSSTSYRSFLPSIVANITAQQRHQHQIDSLEETKPGSYEQIHHHHHSRRTSRDGSHAGHDRSSGVPREKNRCYEHGCNGRVFSTFSNLLRHQREKAGTSSKSSCPQCGAEFTRTTARNSHIKHGKCRERRDSQASEDDRLH